jgi:hypothetical protein
MVMQLTVFVTKADGSRQEFDKEKVVKTCLRMGASTQAAYEIAQKVERRLYDGISTRAILKMIFTFMRRNQPGVGQLFDLKRGLSLMSPRPEFELFVQVLLAYQGFQVEANQILKGKCVEHEVDAIARKDGITYFVEAKHHFSYHALTGLDESRIAQAVLEDVSENYASGGSGLKIDRAMIITNTRYSMHAAQYGRCRNILQVGWSSPENFGLQKMIEDKKLYPLSCLKGLKGDMRSRLVNSGIVLIKQLLEQDPSSLASRAGLQQDALREIMAKAQLAANTLRYS